VNPRTEWPLMVSSLGVLGGMAMLGYWALAYRPARAALRKVPSSPK
jgi:alpha-1,2-mannosyltransferase